MAHEEGRSDHSNSLSIANPLQCLLCLMSSITADGMRGDVGQPRLQTCNFLLGIRQQNLGPLQLGSQAFVGFTQGLENLSVNTAIVLVDPLDSLLGHRDTGKGVLLKWCHEITSCGAGGIDIQYIGSLDSRLCPVCTSCQVPPPHPDQRIPLTMPDGNQPRTG